MLPFSGGTVISVVGSSMNSVAYPVLLIYIMYSGITYGTINSVSCATLLKPLFWHQCYSILSYIKVNRR